MVLPIALIAATWLPALFGQTLVLAAGIPMSARTALVRRTIPLHLAGTSSSLVQERLYNLNVTLEGTEFQVMLDTGSSDLWIDTSTSNIASLIDANKSGIADTGVSALLEYGVDGGYTYARGTVQYGDMHLSGPIGMSAHNQSFVNVPGTTNITQFGNSGILGLSPYDSWSVIREAMEGTAWGTDLISTTMFRENPMVDRMFTLSFNSRDATGIIHSGAVNIGDVDPAIPAVQSSPKIPLMTGSFWDVPSQGFFVDDEAVKFGNSSEELTVILDSGVYGVLAPPEYVEAIFGRIPGSVLLGDGTWDVPCDTKMNVAVSLGSSIYPIHPIDLTEVYGVRDGQPLCKSIFVSNTDQDLPFLVGLGVMKSLVVLHHFGESATWGPYLQMMSTIDMDRASLEFDEMNPARIRAFVESHTIVSTDDPSHLSQSTSSAKRLPSQSIVMTSLRTFDLHKDIDRAIQWARWYVLLAVLFSTTSLATLYLLYQRSSCLRKNERDLI